MEIPIDGGDSISESEGGDLDEDGFPRVSFSDEEAVDRTVGDDSERESFASEFYRSGTEWSCLIDSKEKKLVQADLFRMWGFKRPSQVQEGSSSRVSSKKMRRSGGGDRSIGPAKKGSVGGNNRPRICPFYKKIPGTSFTVDAFRYGRIDGCLAYFLTHFHGDHYGGLNKGWSHGPIYCTPLTARLVKMCLSVNPQYICPLELNVEYIIEGIKVTMLEANHCPGAALIHFGLHDGQSYLHTGDFRACKQMQSYPILLNKRIDVLYLDTTYCNPKYKFPLREEVVNFVVKIARNSLENRPKTLIVVGAYSIGKEHVYLSISQELGVPIYTNASRRRILQSFGWHELSGKLSSDGHSTPLHVLPLPHLRHENLKQYLRTQGQSFTSVLAFRPTGWTFSESIGSQLDRIRPNSNGNVVIYGVPYSEHSSFTELREFVQFLKPKKIIPTVNVGNAAHRDRMQSYFRQWLGS
ncbi:DNA cross-link repair protein SNM1 [Acorus gramineus]|uniref:DNA cross-link repair protein SNM1 n=1 Tax=Acorus gramineus TaxID=55184 RepID=A0AAV9B2P1_ACOGR|nr:DNA cross-link repair protein SNM1 [Acorus gramineus]